ncbi:hypothetical protein D8674_018203 [Pyrus ussuriensis x Pyrus communis]|uniref:Uncharacterized protein n=1 Tax=Pyrus ussuriensis x Pyrus communis TaxID=2448454 RepID=A0A5N5G8S2_9ROSA|nr:hypothetical protein D8674_018203 [Pyrus ussuriensis x Pyrus communis]
MGEFRRKGEGADKTKQKKGKEEKRRKKEERRDTAGGTKQGVGPLGSPNKVQKQF